jgi:hypothetical protein
MHILTIFIATLFFLSTDIKKTLAVNQFDGKFIISRTNESFLHQDVQSHIISKVFIWTKTFVYLYINKNFIIYYYYSEI